MPPPWTIDGSGFVDGPHSIEHPDVSPGDWSAVESYIGLPLPTDYKELIGDGNEVVFGDELFIRSPFVRLGLFDLIADSSWIEASLRQDHPEEHPEAVFPEPSGILTWGTDGGGGVYHWDTSDPDPDRWTIVVTGRPILSYICEDVGLSGYLSGLADGTIKAAALSNWPKPNPEVRRI